MSEMPLIPLISVFDKLPARRRMYRETGSAGCITATSVAHSLARRGDGIATPASAMYR